jgi:hypothetical protein
LAYGNRGQLGGDVSLACGNRGQVGGDVSLACGNRGQAGGDFGILDDSRKRSCGAFGLSAANVSSSAVNRSHLGAGLAGVWRCRSTSGNVACRA